MFTDEDNYPSIDALMISLEEAIYQKDQDAMTVVFNAQDAEFGKMLNVSLRMRLQELLKIL